MDKGKEALIWITDILDKHKIPYQIEGGMAAICYGSTRELADIDMFIPSYGFEQIAADIKDHSVFGPASYFSSHWRLIYQVIIYHNQQIELCDASDAQYLNTLSNEWIDRIPDFSKAENLTMFGIPVKVIPKDDLIEYKSRLRREVDLIDIAQMTERND